ncbi:MAG TPA: GYD domain-containing protein [Gemmatimonadales bacterium]|jgi:uncharacterized protein with GYD domain
MPTYISLLRFTQQGLANAKSGPARLDAGKEAYRKAGGELKAFYLTRGQYDTVVIAELPSDEAVAQLALTFGAAGNVRSESFRAFTETEYRKIAAGVG